jgi:hypothetical protein
MNIRLVFRLFKGKESLHTLFSVCIKHKYDTGPLEHWVCSSNPARGMNVCAFFCVVLSCVGRGLAKGRTPVQRDLPKYLNGFIVSEANTEQEQARGPNP